MATTRWADSAPKIPFNEIPQIDSGRITLPTAEGETPMLDGTIPVSLESFPNLGSDSVVGVQIQAFYYKFFDTNGFGPRFYGLVTEGDHFILVTELIEGADLYLNPGHDVYVQGTVPALEQSVLDTVDAFSDFVRDNGIVVSNFTMRVSATRAVLINDPYYFTGNFRTVFGSAFDTLRALVASKVTT